MISAFGGWDAMAAALRMPSRAALENRVYERQGQGILARTAIEMQRLSGVPAFAEHVAQMSGGVFLPLPDFDIKTDEDLFDTFNALYAELGILSSTFRKAIEDNEVDPKERADLTQIGQNIHRTVQELLALTFMIYCRPEERREPGPVERAGGNADGANRGVPGMGLARC